MRESIKVIKWCGSISFLFLIMTYLVSVNIESCFISVDSVWISNNFLLTLLGGVFTSMLVVALCEVQKYLSAKANTEQYLFSHGFYLYLALVQMKANATGYLNHQELQVPKNLFNQSIMMIQGEMNALENTDYATFKHKQDTLMYEHGKLQADTLQKLQPLLLSGNRLEIAIIKEKIDDLKGETHYTGAQKVITSSRDRVKHVLNAEVDRLSVAISLIDQYLEKIDKYCGNRFRWHEKKDKLIIPDLLELMSKDTV